jgi:hypothetical protein
MTLFTKKAAGIGLTLLGGLAMVHGAAAGQPWETWVGLLVLAVGLGLLAAKIVRRNTAGRPRD